MRVPLSWLKEYVEVNLSPAELADRLAMTGTEVDAVEPVGQETVLELEVTPNRPDCLGVIGVAREVSAITESRKPGKHATKTRLKKPAIKLKEGDTKTSDEIKVEIKAVELCPRYAARIVSNLQVRESPAWLKRRLEAAGIRALNNLVDVTNYVMLETAQPLHAFDMRFVKNRKIVVRKATAGEKLVTLDGVTRALTDDMLVIADAEKPLALAGIMGGANSEVSERTTTVLLESANFQPKNIMRTSRDLGLMTESSTRFEKGIDPNGVLYALDRAASLLEELAGGTVSKGACDVYARPAEPRTLALRPERVNSLLGTRLSTAEIRHILEGLELKTATNTTISVTVPTFRVDLEREIDLIEEIARVHGYENIPSRLKRGAKGGLTFAQKMENRIKEQLVSAGLREVITYSFIGSKEFDALQVPDGFPLRTSVRLKNPLTEDQALMRTTLLPGILEILRLNAQRAIHDVQVFEMGRVFQPVSGQSLPYEAPVIAAALTGRWRENEWYGASRPIDFYDGKGIVETVVGGLGIADWKIEKFEHPSLHPGRSGTIRIGDEVAGMLGEIHPEVLGSFGLANKVAYFELDQKKLIAAIDLARTFKEIPRFPAVSLDIAVLVDEDVTADTVALVIKDGGGALLESVHLFDLYVGQPIPAGKKSLAYSLVFRDRQRTLSENEVKQVFDHIVANLHKKLAARIRS